jgi:phycobilisome rod-core linker protein
VAIPLLNYTPISRNVRVTGYEVPGDEQPRICSAENSPSGSEWDEIIWAAYRQIYSEHQILKANRQTYLESQLKFGQITVRDFIRGLATSEPFLNRNFQTNSNYRFAEMCIQRILGRDVYSEREKIAWSIVIVNKGVPGFIDELLNTDEYLESFGFDTVPYQRRRVLPQRNEGETPFNLKTPRYDSYHRTQLGFPQIIWQTQIRRFTPQEQQVTAGNPANFLEMARAVAPAVNTVARVSLGNINIETQVPYRKV